MEIVRAVEAYHEAHGEYPETLEEAGVTDDQTPWGAWHYQRNDTQAQPGLPFHLGIFDYGRQGIEMWWRGEEKGWYVDT